MVQRYAVVLRSTKDEVPRLPSACRPKIIIGSVRA
jgi:hypothetical protein